MLLGLYNVIKNPGTLPSSGLDCAAFEPAWAGGGYGAKKRGAVKWCKFEHARAVLGLEGGVYGCTVGTGGLGHPDRFIARQQWGIEEELSEKDLDGSYLRTGKTRS